MAFDPLNFPDNFMYRNGLYIGRKGAKIVTSTDGENYTVRYETSSDINIITYIEKVLGIEGFGFYFATSADSFLFSDDGIHWIDIPVNIEILNLVQVPSGLIISNHTDGKTYKLRM
jgi:hypothetical protein